MHIRDKLLSPLQIMQGVPQGSILGRFLTKTTNLSTLVSELFE